MAFPWDFHANFELGDNSEFTSEADTSAQLDFPHYSELARFPWPTAAPYTGAYCMRASLTGGTADAYVETTSITAALDARTFFRFGIWFSPTFDATADDTVAVLELQSAGPVNEAVFGFRYVEATDVINFGIGETAPATFSSGAIQKGVWYTVELDVTVDDGASDDGTIDMYVTRDGDAASTSVAATQVASLDQAAIAQARFGVQDHLATTTGVILLDELVQDSARIYPITERYAEQIVLHKSGHAFIGNGVIDNITLNAGGAADNVLQVYDTDTGDTNDVSSFVTELKNTAADETVDPAGMPVSVRRGCYVSLAGTDPRATVNIHKAAHHNTANIRRYGLRRTL